ncbi:MAG TPA: hypothetical protein VFP79_13460, partial [Pseudolabrys sp.]|nr:hypothetical protein [Pseudolabrys sp.]
VPGTEHLMPRAAITTTGDQAAGEHLAREVALRDIAEESGEPNSKVVPMKKAGKAKPKNR